MLLTSATSFTGTPPSYKFKNKGSQATSFANNVVAADASLDESVNLTCSEYQQLLSLLNSHSHFGTQAPPGGGSDTHQVANIITQPTIALQGHEVSGIWSAPSLDYSVFSSSAVTTQISSSDWILDSGATNHMIHSIHFFTSITSIVHISIRLLNGDMAKVSHIGIVQVTPTLLLENVLCIPTFSFNLMSISKLTQSSSSCCIFLSQFCLIQDLQHWKMIGLSKKQGGLYTLQRSQSTASLPESVSTVLAKLSKISSFCFNSCTSDVDNTSLWHCRLGHPSPQRLVLLHSLVPDVINCNINKTFDCSVCPLAKQKMLPFPASISSSSSSSCFDLIHADIWGPYSTPSLNGSKYFLTLVDDHSRCTWVYIMKHKSETSCLIQTFYNMIFTQFKVPIKMLRSDNGPEFALNSFYASKGIIHQLSCVETPQQNLVVERKHQHLLAVVRALSFKLIFL